MIEDIISEHLRVLRVGADLSQEKLAKKVGLTRQTINAIERKRKRPSKVQAIALYHIIHNTDYGRKILGDVDID
ncbi:MAG: helix-turn-helix transcriptional regulator [Bacillota bacterium]